MNKDIHYKFDLISNYISIIQQFCQLCFPLLGIIQVNINLRTFLPAIIYRHNLFNNFVYATPLLIQGDGTVN